MKLMMKKKTCIVTGFEPFGGESINPTLELLKILDSQIGNYEIITQALPVIYGKAWLILKEKIEIVKPDLVICLGQAGGRKNISLERIALNIRDAHIPDNDGVQPDCENIINDGTLALETNIEIKNIKNILVKEGYQIEISNSAGTYVCNDIFYNLMNYIYANNLDVKADFIHVPYLKEQVKNKNDTPYMNLNEMKLIIEKIIDCL